MMTMAVALLLCLSAMPVRAGMYADLLKRHGIDPSAEGVREHLREYRPDADQRSEVSKLVAQLGADEFSQREAAEAALLGKINAARPALIRALRSDDPEVRWRAGRVLKRADIDAERIFHAVLKVIERQEYKGLAADLLPLFDHLATEDQRDAAIRALRATAVDTDAKLLREAMTSDRPVLRAAAARALGAAIGDKARGDLKPMLADDDARVRLEAALALSDLGDAACLPALADLLESTSLSTRLRAVRALRWLTGQKFNYVADFGPDDPNNADAVRQWRRWIAEHGDDATLRYPVVVADSIVLFNGQDLAGWQAVLDGQRVGGRDVWSVKDGVLVCNGRGAGYLRTTRAFINYELSLEWRWPGEKGGDSGVWLMLDGIDRANPKALEVQLHNDKAGEFWMLGGMTVSVDGRPQSSHAPRQGPASERPPGQWNRMTIRLSHGDATVKVNGQTQNRATDCPKGPGKIGLQVEGHAIEFRHIVIQPLED